LYRILNYFIAAGIIIIIYSLSRMLINPRRTLNRQDMTIRQAEANQLSRELTQTHRKW